MWTPTATGYARRDQAVEREVEALDNAERYQSSTVEVDDHSTETVGGIKKVVALGALKLLSGGSASLAAVDDLHQATGRDLNLVVGQKHNATVGGDKQTQIQGQFAEQIKGRLSSAGPGAPPGAWPEPQRNDTSALIGQQSPRRSVSCTHLSATQEATQRPAPELPRTRRT